AAAAARGRAVRRPARRPTAGVQHRRADRRHLRADRGRHRQSDGRPELMARYPLGQPVRLSTTVKDLTGALTNPTTLTLTVKRPDASTQAYSSPTNDGTGLYHQDLQTSD